MIIPRFKILGRPRRHKLRRRRSIRIGLGSLAPVNTLAAANSATGLYRVADATLDRYELYRGINVSPNFSSSPWQTSATLPITTAALTAANTHHLVTRKRNKWGLLSQNITEKILPLDGSGNLLPTPPSDPDFVAVAPAAGGKVLVTAHYAPGPDGPNAADGFLLYLTNTGVNPNPSVDSPTVFAMTFVAGVARLSTLTAVQTEGATIKAIVRARHTGSPNADSASVTIHSAVATLLGPPAPAGAGF